LLIWTKTIKLHLTHSVSLELAVAEEGLLTEEEERAVKRLIAELVNYSH
jgi:hypothetical protein